MTNKSFPTPLGLNKKNYKITKFKPTLLVSLRFQVQLVEQSVPAPVSSVPSGVVKLDASAQGSYRVTKAIAGEVTDSPDKATPVQM